MTLIDFTKDQLSIIETSLKSSLKYADSEYISEVDNILEKIKNLDNVCDCGGKTNWYIIENKGSYVMSDEEIKTFITTFKSFMNHASVEEMNYLRRESTRKYKQLYYKNQAKQLGVSYDYFISEFT